MNIHIPQKYLWYGGLAVAAGLAYWYLKSNGYWDTWFSPQGNVIPVGANPAAVPQTQGLMVPGQAQNSNAGGFVN
jgi:hypothetical protein